MKTKLVMLTATLGFISSLLVAQTGTEFSLIQKRISDIYNENADGVFRVMAAFTTFDEKGDQQTTQTSGTGCFISREGHILANAMVVQNSDRTWYVYDGVNYSSELIGIEPQSNIAILKANNLPEDFKFFVLEANQSLPEIGSMAVMISCPWDFSPTPSLTMVAGEEMGFARRKFVTTHLRINKVILAGEGGAPLIDLNGRFLGVQIAGTPPDVAAGFVLPTRAILRIRDDLLFAGKFIRGWIGIDIGVRSTIRDGRQIYLSNIVSESPAEKGGLKDGDVLVRIGDFSIQTIADVSNAMFFARAGQFLDLQVFRDGVLQDFTVKVVEPPDDQPEPAEITNPSEEPAGIPEPDKDKEEKPS
ncbi:MAG: PDZ domain-containing protein [Verrucomicrobiae bacterium]|nr:PDZ domain-containing protein [Verrucomicrobiae bacterium]